MRLSLMVLMLAAFVMLSGRHVLRSDASVSPACEQSFAAFSALSGHWTGTWQNHTFQSNGNLSADLEINDDCTFEVTVTGIFGTIGQRTIAGTFSDNNGGLIIEVQDDPLLGDLTITVEADGSFDIAGGGAHQDIATVDGSGTFEPGHIELDLSLQFGAGGSATESIELTQDAPPTPSLTPTAGPSATAAVTPSPTIDCSAPTVPQGAVGPANTCTPPPTTPTTVPGEQLVWGDWNCADGPNPVDSLLNLRHDAGLATNTGDCPDMGQTVDVQNASEYIWGDADCNGVADPVDSLKLLRFDAGLSVSQEPECPEIGSDVVVSGS